MPTKTKLHVSVVGGLGLMSSPMAKHWREKDSVQVLRVHDRGTPGERRDNNRQAWREYGAALVSNFKDLVGQGDLDGIFVCAGKNGDDLPVIASLADLLSKNSPGAFICHMSTVSPTFVNAAHQFCTTKNIRYLNYPLTGGPAGSESASMLILASGDPDLYQQLSPSLSFIGKPQHFGNSVTAATEVKLIGHLMVFNGLIGICSAAATHTECLNNAQLGGEKQGLFFDYLNAGSGGTKQWDSNLSNGIKKDIWNKGFFMRHAVVDAIYLVQMLIEHNVSWLAIESVLNTALAFSYVINKIDPDLATHAIVREMIAKNSTALDKFLIENSGPRGDHKASLTKCIESLPEHIRKTVALNVTVDDFNTSGCTIMTNHSNTRFWLWGGLTGLLLPIALFALLLVCNRITSGIVLVLPLVTVFFLEAPPVIIGRMLNLPIEINNEISDPIFIVYQLSPFGYILAVVFWIFVGVLIGSMIDRILSVKRATKTQSLNSILKENRN